MCKASDAVLGRGRLEVGHPPPGTSGRSGLCWVCARPWALFCQPSALPCSLNSWRTPPLKLEILARRPGYQVVRELTGGIYFREEKGVKDTDLGPAAYDIEQYAEEEVRRIAKVAFDMAMKRSKHVTSVDKANVLSPPACGGGW